MRHRAHRAVRPPRARPNPHRARRPLPRRPRRVPVAPAPGSTRTRTRVAPPRTASSPPRVRGAPGSPPPFALARATPRSSSDPTVSPRRRRRRARDALHGGLHGARVRVARVRARPVVAPPTTTRRAPSAHSSNAAAPMSNAGTYLFVGASHAFPRAAPRPRRRRRARDDDGRGRGWRSRR